VGQKIRARLGPQLLNARKNLTEQKWAITSINLSSVKKEEGKGLGGGGHIRSYLRYIRAIWSNNQGQKTPRSICPGRGGKTLTCSSYCLRVRKGHLFFWRTGQDLRIKKTARIEEGLRDRQSGDKTVQTQYLRSRPCSIKRWLKKRIKANWTRARLQ